MNPDTAHPREEEAIAYAFGLMDATARSVYERELKADAELRALVDELQATTGALTLDAPQMSAPAELREKVLNETKTIVQEQLVRPRQPVVLTRQPNPWPWMTAVATIALCGVYYVMSSIQEANEMAWMSKEELLQSQISGLRSKVEESMKASAARAEAMEKQLAARDQETAALKQLLAERTQATEQLRVELAKATKANDSAKMQIAMLQSTVAEYQQGVAVVVWNPEKQEGILKLEKMPPVEAGKDYQLWVVDPAHKTPVNAGIVKVDEKGFAKVDFKPTLDIEKANNFAISIEQAGGVPENKGPIVLLSP